MKKLVVLVVSFFVFLSLQAQKTETLFSRSHVIGAFGAPIVEFGIGDDSDLGTYVGGGGGLVLDNFFLGAYGMGGSNLDRFINNNDDEFTLDIAHGGLWVGFVAPSHKLIHFYSSVKVGWGAVDIRFDDNDDLDFIDGIFAVTPDFGLEVNVFRWFRVGATAGYRFVDGVSDRSNIDKDKFNGWIGTLTFRIGGFGNWRRQNRDDWD